MARPSKKSIQRSINGRKNIRNRFDKFNQVTRQGGEGCGGEEDEELQLVEILLSQSEIENSLKRLRFRPEADKRLKYTTRPGGSERSIRRFSSRFRNVDASVKPRTIFNFTASAVLTGNGSEDGNRKELQLEHERSQLELEEAPNDGEDENAVEEDSYGSEGPVDIRGLLKRIEVRLLSKNKMPPEEILQLTVLKRYFIDLLKGTGKMKASINAAFYSFDKGIYMARVIRGWAKFMSLLSLCLLSASVGSTLNGDQHWTMKTFVNNVSLTFDLFLQMLGPQQSLRRIYEQVAYPEFSGSLNKATISLHTITRYLTLWGFALNAHTKDIYYDGHERPDVIEYRKRWASTMMNYRAKMREYGGEDCTEVILPNLDDREHEIVQLDRKRRVHIKKKGQGLGLMVSDFCCACHGSLQFEGQYAREIIEPGKNRDGFWVSNDMVLQLEKAIDIFEKSHPGCVGLFCVDQSSNHQALPSDAIAIRKFTLKDKKMKDPIKPGYFELNGQRYVQEMCYSEGHPKFGWQKGMRTILEERQLWHDKLP